MDRANLRSPGKSITVCEYFYKKDLKIVNEDSWSDSGESAHEEINKSCLMAFGSQELYLEKKRILQQETNKLANRAKELELEIDQTKGIKPRLVGMELLSFNFDFFSGIALKGSATNIGDY
ncbi:hypothetical protein Tco_0660011 [Tanacetum coccineum]